MRQTDLQQAKRVLTYQVFMTFGIAAAMLFFGVAAATSAMLGGAICTLANALFAYWVFARYRAQQPELLVMRFYGAEFLKLGTTLVLFAAAFLLFKETNLPALLGAYFVVQVLPALLASR